MKQILLVAIVSMIGLSFFSCEDDNATNSNGDSASQIMFGYAEHANYYWDDQNDQMVYIENTWVNGYIDGDPMPELEYIKVGDNYYSGDYCSEYYLGYLGFGMYDQTGEPQRITSNFDPLNVEVKTSLGKLNGTINLPDTITTVTFSEYDTLQLGEPLIVSWSGSNADFYDISLEYEWEDDEGYWGWTWIDTFIVGNSITFPGSMFTHSGEIDYFYMEPVNGPFPRAGARGNMTGEGSGFLYYFNSSDVGYLWEDIVVGSGLYRIAKMSSHERSEKEIRSAIRRKIESCIFGN